MSTHKACSDETAGLEKKKGAARPGSRDEPGLVEKNTAVGARMKNYVNQ